jgi:mono/diheme cytochrome c family protein
MIWSNNSFRLLCKQVRAACSLALCCTALITMPAAAQNASNGWRIMFDQRAGNCVACHSTPDAAGKKTGMQSTFAPQLDGVAARYNPATLRQWVVDARKLNADTLMPPFGLILKEADVSDVLAALGTLR